MGEHMHTNKRSNRPASAKRYRIEFDFIDQQGKQQTIGSINLDKKRANRRHRIIRNNKKFQTGDIFDLRLVELPNTNDREGTPMATRRTPTKTKAKPKARRSTPKATPAAKPKATRPLKSKRDEIGKKVVAMRKRNAKGRPKHTWREIAETFGTDLPAVVLAYEYAILDPADKIEGTRKQVAKKIVSAYDNKGLSWQKIQARTGLSFATVKKLYEEASGKSASQGHEKAAKRARKPVRRVATKTKAQPKAKAKPKTAAKSKATATKAKAKPTTKATNKTRRETVWAKRKTKRGTTNP